MTRLRPTRLPEKAVEDRVALDALLDSAFVAHVALVVEDAPLVIPTAAARWDDTLLLHGSTGSRWMRRAAEGVPVSVAVTEVSGLVVARSAFESSLHYRSAVLFGSCHVLDGPDKEHALHVLTDHLIPGRAQEVRASTSRELAATMVLGLPIAEWSLKVSDRWPEDPPEDVDGPAWAGVLPLVTSYGSPQPAPDLRAGIGLPQSMQRLTPPPA